MQISQLSARPPSPARLVSLDVLRGMTVALMILVNNAGDGAVSYSQLRHSVWSGCTLTDIVFPLFLFIVGASITLAFSARLRRGATRTQILLQLLRRSILIFAFGMLMNALPFFDLHTLRLYGVLQRIALCFACAGTLFLYGKVRVCVVAIPLLLLGYWLLLTHVPIPGIGLPGVDVPLLDPFGNLTSWLDRSMLPARHLYHQGVYDPEGLLSTLPAIATALLGVVSSVWIQTARPVARKSASLAVCGVCCVASALLWAHALPLNKRLWTSSFALFTGGISMLLWAAMYYLVDGPPRWRRGLKPWLALGTNALTAYILSEVLAILLAAISLSHQLNLQQWLFMLLPRWLGSPSFVSLVYSVLFVAACFIPVYVLYQRRIFLKI